MVLLTSVITSSVWRTKLYLGIDSVVVRSEVSFSTNAQSFLLLSRIALCQADASFDTVCKGCEVECEQCVVEGMEPLCVEQLDHTSAAGGNTTIDLLSIDTGYWRATNTSTEILECYNTDACDGGVTGEEGYCLEGYEGPCKYATNP